MATKVSPLAPTQVPDMPAIDGVRLATAAAGIRYPGRTDVLLIALDPGTAVAGVFTQSKCASAPVEWCRAQIKGGAARALVVNSGNANAFTGKTGREACKLTAALAGKAVGCKPAEVFLASTGVIGEPLDASKFGVVMDGLARDAQSDGRWLDAARAIMTTDTFPKVATATAAIGRTRVTLCGIAKGAGMIAPDMATMLSFVFTDAPIAARALQRLLKDAVTDTFNAVTIDGDTSTSDTLMAFATGAAAARGAPRIASAGDARLTGFRKVLTNVLADLSEQVARDGEGARKLVEIDSRGRGVENLRAEDRDVDCEFAAGEDRDCRRRRQLGPRRDGGRQGWRASRSRQALDLVRRHPRCPQGHARSGLRRSESLRGDEGPEDFAESRARARQGT